MLLGKVTAEIQTSTSIHELLTKAIVSIRPEVIMYNYIRPIFFPSLSLFRPTLRSHPHPSRINKQNESEKKKKQANIKVYLWNRKVLFTLAAFFHFNTFPPLLFMFATLIYFFFLFVWILFLSFLFLFSHYHEVHTCIRCCSTI